MVESDASAANGLARFFQSEGVSVDRATTGREALERLGHAEFELMILNMKLPDMDGSTVLRRIRAACGDLPVLALFNSLDPAARLEALADGADDVVDCSIGMAEILARTRAIVRRSRGRVPPVLQSGPLTLDLGRQEVRAGSLDVRLTRTEFAILQLLMLRKNLVVTKEAILAHLYGGRTAPDAAVIEVFMCKIRRKLAKAGLPDVISTVWWRGYTIRGAVATNGPKPPVPVLEEHAA